ncbi:MAG: Txe/YoeB family addiction module toxin [Methylococcaceae bacterium]|nr:Txe/YoeB family addiction module toxin [Methylococcaceae bacterium]
MIIAWSENAWEDYLYWQANDKKILKRINSLVTEITRHPFSGAGNPEALKHQWSGYWSRRINQEHRIIYKVSNDMLIIAQCRYHY